MLSQLIDKGPELLPFASIRTDGGTQMRAHLDEATVREYAAIMEDADGWGPFPPVVVYYDGATYWLADGFHRLEAARTAPTVSVMRVPADVRSGTRRDAILHAATANATHGLRRTDADKRRAVETLLRDEEWRAWSDREIARRCGVSHPFVARVRASLETVTSDERTYTTKHGTTATMNTAAIGARPAPPAPPPAPGAVERVFVAADPPARTGATAAPAPQPAPEPEPEPVPASTDSALMFVDLAIAQVENAIASLREGSVVFYSARLCLRDLRILRGQLQENK